MKNELYTLFFEVTKRCNALCKHCGSRCTINSDDELDALFFKKVLDDIKGKYGTDKIMLNITGGEPLMRGDLFEITGYADMMGFKWGLVTNGMLITDDTIRKMEQTHMSTITISMDGMRDTHEKFRNVRGCFDKIVENIIRLTHKPFVEHIQVTFIATKENIKELPELYRMLSSIGIDSLRISGIDPIGRAEDNRYLMLGRQDYEYLFQFMKSKEGSRLPVVWSCSHYFGDDGIHNDPTGKLFRCYTGIHVGSVLCNGDIFGCPNIPRVPELIMGNVKTDNFCDVWENRFEFYRNPDRLRADQCRECSYYKNCRGDSMHTFDFESKKQKFCYREIFGREPADAVQERDIPCNGLVMPYREPMSYDNIISAMKLHNNRIHKLTVRNAYDKPAHKIVFSPQAAEDMYGYFHYGKKHPLNMYEQQMAMIGNYSEDVSFVRFVIPVPLKNRSGNMAVMDDGCLKDIDDEVSVINENLAGSDDDYKNMFGDIEFLGFIHSHQGTTDFRFSKNDTKNHMDFTNMYGRFDSVLINPQEKIISGFYGHNCMQAQLEVFTCAEPH